ncbi:hypothetical protein KNCP2_00650 [Candidatus Rickettsia kedanie]|uniref:Uncharacterized protein n=1 Tax=Candidatus Rickettsia kedanie TaxID=3115352 RepID=A0ABP9TUA5_9RICK
MEFWGLWWFLSNDTGYVSYTEERIKEFESMLKCEEGALSYPFIIKTQNLGSMKEPK